MDQGGKKRRFETISFLSQPSTLYLDTSIGGHTLASVLDTGATASAVSSRFTGAVQVERGTAIPVKMGDGGIVFSQGTAEVQVVLGRKTILQKVMVLDTTAFDAVLGMDFMNNPLINGLLFRPARLVVDNETVPLREEYQGKIRCMFRLFNTESYFLKPNLREYALATLGLKKTDVRVDLFASQGNAQEEIYCTRQNSAWQYLWNELVGKPEEVLWANPPFSKLLRTLTKVALEGVRLVLVTPDWNCGRQESWRRILDRLTTKRVVLPQGPTYIREKDKRLLPQAGWRTLVSLIDGSIRVDEELDYGIVKQVKRLSKGRTLAHLKSVLEEGKVHQAFREVPAGGEDTDLPTQQKSNLRTTEHVDSPIKEGMDSPSVENVDLPSNATVESVEQGVQTEESVDPESTTQENVELDGTERPPPSTANGTVADLSTIPAETPRELLDESSDSILAELIRDVDLPMENYPAENIQRQQVVFRQCVEVSTRAKPLSPFQQVGKTSQN